MSQWREVDELLQDGRQRLHAAQLQMQQANDDPLAGTQQLIELNQTKPNADWVFLLQKLIIEGNLEGPSVHKLQTELSEQAETISNYRDFLRNYRTQKESFRRLVQGCSNKEIDFATYTHCLEEWKRIKELYIESPLHDPHLTREFVALDCLFQMVYFLAEPKGQDHGKVKLSISSLISKWDAEDLIMENDASAGLLNTFLSNQKDRFSLLGKRESQVRTVGHQPNVDGQSLNRRKRALPMVSCKPSTEKVYKEKKDCFNHKVYTSTKRLSSPYEQLESTRTQTLNLNSHSKIENSEINKLSQFSKTLTNLSYEELCETVKDKDLAQQQKCLQEIIARNYERVRKQAKEAFLGIIRSEFKDENAIYHVNKLEAEIFSLFYYDLETYKEKAQDCANSLRDLFQKGTPLDCVMATSLDYTTIMNKSPILDYLSEDRLIDWNHYNLTSRDLEDVSQLRSDNLGQSASSEACDEITNPDLRPDMNLEDISSLADKLDKDSVSFEFLEELTKIKEEEIKKLKDILQNIQKENDLLKDALLEVRTHLIALESNEISLDKLSET